MMMIFMYGGECGTFDPSINDGSESYNVRLYPIIAPRPSFGCCNGCCLRPIPPLRRHNGGSKLPLMHHFPQEQFCHLASTRMIALAPGINCGIEANCGWCQVYIPRLFVYLNERVMYSMCTLGGSSQRKFLRMLSLVVGWCWLRRRRR